MNLKSVLLAFMHKEYTNTVVNRVEGISGNFLKKFSENFTQNYGKITQPL
jgi:hypothetical protein